MALRRFRIGNRKDIFLYRTQVENLFINEFLPDAPGECVKVFLFGLMYAQFDQEIDSRTLALTLGLNEKDVDNAWKYWESKGLVRIISVDGPDRYDIEFVRQIDLFYGKTVEEAAVEEPQPDNEADAIIAHLINQQLKEIFDKYQMLTGRTLSRHEASKLTDAIKVYNIEPDILDFAIDYCVGLDKYSVDYINKVALRWTEEGCRDVAEVKMMLDRHSRRNDFYRKVFGALGFSRIPNPSDREIMDRWFDEMGCSITEVLEACKAAAGLRDPNLRYVNKVLENKALEKGGINTRKEPAAGRAENQQNTDVPQAMVSRKVLKDYYDYIRECDEQERKVRIRDVSSRIPAIRNIIEAETSLGRELITAGSGAEAKEKRQRLRNKRQSLEENKRNLLIDNGYPEDYLDRKYRCGICRDTGYTDEGRVCTCCRERAAEAYRWIQETETH